MSLKKALLNPKKEAPVIATMFGGKYPVEKMSTARVTEIEFKMGELRESGNPQDINHYTASVILDAMVDEKGVKMSKSVKEIELLEAYGPGAISDALNAVYQVNYSGSEGADAAKKD